MLTVTAPKQESSNYRQGALARTHARAHARTHTHTHARTHARTHTHTLTYTRKMKDETHLPTLPAARCLRRTGITIL